MTAHHLLAVLLPFSSCWIAEPLIHCYVQRKRCSLGTRAALFNLPGAVPGGLSELLLATALI